jgi:L-cystine transport system permease protein
MMGEAKILGARGLRFFEVYMAVAMVYWAICFLIERLVALAEKRVRRFEGLAAVRPS